MLSDPCFLLMLLKTIMNGKRCRCSESESGKWLYDVSSCKWKLKAKGWQKATAGGGCKKYKLLFSQREEMRSQRIFTNVGISMIFTMHCMREIVSTMLLLSIGVA